MLTNKCGNRWTHSSQSSIIINVENVRSSSKESVDTFRKTSLTEVTPTTAN